MRGVRVGGDQQIADAPPRQETRGAVQYLHFRVLGVDQDHIQKAAPSIGHKDVDLEGVAPQQRRHELGLQPVVGKDGLGRLQPLLFGADQHDTRLGPRAFHPHAEVAREFAEIEHDRRLRQALQQLLEDEFGQGLQDPPVDHQDLTEVAVVGRGTFDRGEIAVVQRHPAVTDQARLRNPLDQEVQGIGDDLPKPAGEIVRCSFLRHRGTRVGGLSVEARPRRPKAPGCGRSRLAQPVRCARDSGLVALEAGLGR